MHIRRSPIILYVCALFIFRWCPFFTLDPPLIFVVKSLKGLRGNNVGPASQTVAQHYFSIGPMDGERHPHNAAVRKHVQSPNAVSMTGQREWLWVNIETALGECNVFAQSIQQTQWWISVWLASRTIDRQWTNNGLRRWHNIEPEFGG